MGGDVVIFLGDPIVVGFLEGNHKAKRRETNQLSGSLFPGSGITRLVRILFLWMGFGNAIGHDRFEMHDSPISGEQMDQ